MARFRYLRHRVGLVCCAALWLAGAGLVWAEELRTWSDASGKHKMEAEYAGMSGTKVKLTLKTGKKMEIELKQLSKADQKYIESLDADNPFQAADEPQAESPFQAKESEGDEMEKPESSGKESSGKSVSGEVTVDWNQSEALLLDSEADEWKATVAPHPGWDSKPKTIVLPPRSDFFEATTGMAVNHVAQKAVVCFRLGREDKDSQVRLMICDLKTGKAGSIATEQALMTPIALHDDGQQVLR